MTALIVACWKLQASGLTRVTCRCFRSSQMISKMIPLLSVFCMDALKTRRAMTLVLVRDSVNEFNRPREVSQPSQFFGIPQIWNSAKVSAHPTRQGPGSPKASMIPMANAQFARLAEVGPPRKVDLEFSVSVPGHYLSAPNGLQPSSGISLSSGQPPWLTPDPKGDRFRSNAIPQAARWVFCTNL